jgi:hypothetical protein
MGYSQSPSSFMLQAPHKADGTQPYNVPKLQAGEANHSIIFTNVITVFTLAITRCKKSVTLS